MAELGWQGWNKANAKVLNVFGTDAVLFPSGVCSQPPTVYSLLPGRASPIPRVRF